MNALIYTSPVGNSADVGKTSWEHWDVFRPESVMSVTIKKEGIPIRLSNVMVK